MSVLNYLIGQMIAEREGADESFRQTAGLVLYSMGLKPVSLLMIVTLARQNAEARLRQATADASTPEPGAAGTSTPEPGAVGTSTTDPRATGTSTTHPRALVPSTTDRR